MGLAAAPGPRTEVQGYKMVDVLWGQEDGLTKVWEVE
jgi:hypothetical protein